MSEERYRMALEAIATMLLPYIDHDRVDAIMQRIAKEAIKNIENPAINERGGDDRI